MNDRPFHRQPRNRSMAPTPQEQVLAEWRGVNLAPIERARASPAKSTAEIIPRVVQKLGLDKRQIETELLKVWNHILDPAVVTHAQPTGLRNGTLFVTVDSSVWLDEIVRYQRKEILTRLQHSFGRDQIARISFRLG